jgi:hypothetical protein
MGAGYKAQPDGPAAQAAVIKRLRKENDDLRRMVTNAYLPQPTPTEQTVAALTAALQAAGILTTP